MFAQDISTFSKTDEATTQRVIPPSRTLFCSCWVYSLRVTVDALDGTQKNEVVARI